jgi:hypothetical protein
MSTAKISAFWMEQQLPSMMGMKLASSQQWLEVDLETK